ncbi:unnamed protein product [marine sediment metagenome]|uniref:Endonuclease I n=1 Tax=marine sediment metagenome TaxID=412755 RepID=X0T2Q6_9ZZZZ|tara:strand:+ start:2255 stop:2674 length:420 start_codon:yes stop_codon:yes gene_type:complete
MKRHKKRGKFRSKSEEIVYDSLLELNIPIKYEWEKINYIWMEYKTYTPDFLLPNGIILEVKGRFVLEDRKKHLFIRQQKPELDIRFIFDNPNSKLYKNGKMTYAKWCDKHNFLYCKRKEGIPEEWLNGKRSGKRRRSDI